MIGSNVGGYVILNRIGAGAMGEVYLAQHRRLDRRAAIKILLPGLSKDPDLVSRFFNEARALSRIQHPGIVEVYDCDLLDDRAYIVMEYLEGESMASVLERTGSVAGEAAAVAAVAGQIAVALSAAHEKGIVHRDLKPENVYFGLGRQSPFATKVLDFGIAKLATDNFGGVSQTRPGSLLGTPAYMSPEQCRGVAGIDHRADIYAMGCMLFEMLTGRHVFQMEHFGDLIVAHIGTPAPRASAVVPGVPPVLDELVARMLAKNPDERPQSMNDVIVAMEKFLNLPASAFGQAIPPTSRLVPRVVARAVSPTQAMAAFGTGAGSGSGTATGTPASTEANPGDGSSARRRAQALPVAATRPITGAAGGTQVLPDAEGPRPGVGSTDASSAPNESTFRRSASEMIAPPLEQRRGPLKFVAGVLGLGAAIAAVLVFFAGPSKPRTDEAPAAAASPAEAPPAEVKPPEAAPTPPPVAVPPPPESPPPEPAAEVPVEPPSKAQAQRALSHEDHAPSSKSSSQKPGRKGSKTHGPRDPSDAKSEIKNARPHPKEGGAGKPADYYHPVGD